jgi:hypothetical protein
MTNSVTKKAYARGVGEYLQRNGILTVPSEELLKTACDQAAQLLSVEPAYESVPHADVEKVATVLVQFSTDLAHNGKVASHPASVSLGRNVRTAVGDMIEKVAAEVMDSPHPDPAKNTTSTITGNRNDQQNLLSDSAHAEAKLDAHRPEGYANVGQGNTNFKEPQAARVGTEEPHPMAPGHGGASGNSVTDASKAASIREKLRKMAEGTHPSPAGAPPYGSTIVGSDPNQQNLNADSYNAEAMMDIADRPENYANVGQGNAGIQDVPTSAEVGSETAHPGAPADTGGAATNSVVQATAKSARWERHFQETAQELSPYLPEAMPIDQRINAIKQAMAMEPVEQERFLQKIAEAYTAPRDTIGNVLNSLGQLSRG